MPDLLDLELQPSCLLILLLVVFTLNLRFSSQEHILSVCIIASFILEMAEPGTFWVRLDPLPRVSWDRTNRYGIIRAHIQTDELRHDSLLDFTSVRMLTTASKETRWLNKAIGHLL